MYEHSTCKTLSCAEKLAYDNVDNVLWILRTRYARQTNKLKGWTARYTSFTARKQK